jgi:hypothetical protein
MITHPAARGGALDKTRPIPLGRHDTHTHTTGTLLHPSPPVTSNKRFTLPDFNDSHLRGAGAIFILLSDEQYFYNQTVTNDKTTSRRNNRPTDASHIKYFKHLICLTWYGRTVDGRYKHPPNGWHRVSFDRFQAKNSIHS